MNLDEKIKRIEGEKKRKYSTQRSKQIFHCGIIMLISLVIGRIYFQFEPITSENISPNDLDQLRKVYGNFLGLIIGIGGGLFYLIWTAGQVSKCQKEINKEVNEKIEETVRRIVKEKEKK